MDAAVSTAKELERTEQLIETLEGCKTALHELGTQADSLVREFSPLILALSSTVKAVKEAATVTVSAEARELLEREGLGICQRMLDEFEKRGERLVRQMAPVRNRTSVPTVAFWCMIEVIIFFWLLSSAPAPPTPSSYTVPCCGKRSAIRPGFLLFLLL